MYNCHLGVAAATRKRTLFIFFMEVKKKLKVQIPVLKQTKNVMFLKSFLIQRVVCIIQLFLIF